MKPLWEGYFVILHDEELKQSLEEAKYKKENVS